MPCGQSRTVRVVVCVVGDPSVFSTNSLVSFVAVCAVGDRSMQLCTHRTVCVGGDRSMFSANDFVSSMAVCGWRCLTAS